MLPIIIGLIAAIIFCTYIEFFNPKNFIDPFIVFGFSLFLFVFLYFSLKIKYNYFIKKSLNLFLIELLFIGLFTFIYCFLIYYFRGIKPHFIYFICFSLFFMLIHILLELSGTYSRL